MNKFGLLPIILFILVCIVFMLVELSTFQENIIAITICLWGILIIVFPTSLIAAFAFGLSYLNLNPQALKMANLGLSINNKNPDCLYAKSAALINMKRLSEAEETLKMSAEISRYDLLQNMWTVQYMKCDAGKALDYAERMINLHPSYWLGYYERAASRLLLSQNQNDHRILEDIQTVLKLQPDSIYGYGCRVVLNLDRNKIDEGLEDSLRALKLSKKRKEYALMLVGSSYLRKFDLEKATETLNELVKLESTDYYTVYLRACLFEIQDMHEAALRDLENYERTESFDPALLYLEGNSRCKTNQIIEAYEAACEISERLPEFILGYRLKGMIYNRIGRADKALDQFEAGLNKNSHDLSCLVSKAQIYLQRKEFDKAIEICDLAISESKYCYSAARVKSLCYTALNQITEAERWCHFADDIYCNDGFSWYCHGIISRSKEDYEEALRNFNLAIESDCHTPSYYQERAEVYSELKKDKEAKVDREKAYELKRIIASQAALID